MEVEDFQLPDEGVLQNLCKEASNSFFSEYGLINHQINSYNDFVENGVQKLFDSIGEIHVEPGYDPSKKGGGDGGWKRAKLKFGKVTLEKLMFWAGVGNVGDEDRFLKLLPRHARLQRITYSSRMKVEIEFQVYTLGKKSSDKFKTGKETQIEKDIITQGKKDVVIGRIPVMVGSSLCWMSTRTKGDCDFDQGVNDNLLSFTYGVPLLSDAWCIRFLKLQWYNLIYDLEIRFALSIFKCVMVDKEQTLKCLTLLL